MKHSNNQSYVNAEGIIQVPLRVTETHNINAEVDGYMDLASMNLHMQDQIFLKDGSMYGPMQVKGPCLEFCMHDDDTSEKLGLAVAKPVTGIELTEKQAIELKEYFLGIGYTQEEFPHD